MSITEKALASFGLLVGIGITFIVYTNDVVASFFEDVDYDLDFRD